MLISNKNLVLSLSLFWLTACGGSSNKTVSPQEANETIVSKVPTKISFEIPVSIISSKRSFKKLTITKPLHSTGYSKIKKSISTVDALMKNIKVQLFIVDTVFNTVKNQCTEILDNAPCDLLPNTVSIYIDDKFLNKLNTIDSVSANNYTQFKNTKLPLGAIKYIHYDDSKEHQESIKIDMTNISKRFDSKVNSDSKEISWSKDHKTVYAHYLFNDKIVSYDLEHKYLIKADGTEKIYVHNETKYLTSEPLSSGLDDSDNIFNLKLHQLNDSKNTYNLISDTDYPNDAFKLNYEGVLNKEGGVLVTSYLDDKEEDKFDAQGKQLSSIYCYTSDNCDLNDKSTWLQGDFTTTVTTYVYNIPLKITGPFLDDLIPHLLVPKSIATSLLTPETIEEYSVGEIQTNNFDTNTIDAVLHDNDYQNKLGELEVYLFDKFNTYNQLGINEIVKLNGYSILLK
jgi:hypothetical protein